MSTRTTWPDSWAEEWYQQRRAHSQLITQVLLEACIRKYSPDYLARVRNASNRLVAALIELEVLTAQLDKDAP